MAPIDFRDCAKDVLETAICTFGESVIYTPKVGARLTIRGIFDNEFEQVDADTETVVASNVFTLGILLSDLKKPPEKGDRVIIRRIEYRVVDSQEDGVVGSELFLHRC